MAEHRIGRADEWAIGEQRCVDVSGRAVCVIRSPGRYYAIRNECPHQGASLCQGTVGATMVASGPQEYTLGLEGRVLRCPWHGWEFDLESGRALFDPERMRVRTYPVRVVEGQVLIEI